MTMRKIWSLLLCFMMMFMCIPVGVAEDVPAGSNADLSGLTVAGYDLTPDFDAATTEYAVSIPNEADSVNITADAADTNASLTIGEVAAASGTAHTVSDLTVGDNNIAIEVTAEDGTTVKTYTITVNRADAATAGSNADLSGLTVAGYALTPAFDADTTEYAVSIPNEADSVNITADAANTNASLTIGEVAAASGSAQTVSGLAVGDNNVAIAVTAQDGTTVKTYTIIITRADVASISSNADLSGLTVAGYDLTPAFDAATTEYAVSIPNEADSVNITADAADTNASLTIGEAAAASGTAHTVSGLVVGDNNVAIAVTAQDSTTVKTYTITITRAEAQNPVLQTLAEAQNPLPQTSEAYAASDYAKYNSRLAAGRRHIAAVLQEGTVEVWGDNTYKQLEIPVEATGVKALASGACHTLALKEDGTVVAWGHNYDMNIATIYYGQCNVPNSLDGKIVKAIAASVYTSAALTEDNQINLWGQYNGVLTSTKNLVNIALNNTYLLALAEDGTVEAWTLNDLLPCTIPEGFSGNVVDIKAGYSHSLALKKDGTVAGWGDNYLPDNLPEARAIAAGNSFSAAICQDGTVITWGADDWGYGFLIVPSDLQEVSALSAGWADMYALQADGTVVSWGRNEYGQNNVPADLNLYSEDSSNDRLISLAVKSLDETDFFNYPKFTCEQTEGVVDIAYDITQVRIVPQTYSSTAVLTMNGNIINSGEITEITDLVVGDNPIEINVTAASGSERQRSYTLHIKRVSSGYGLTPLPQTPEAYQASDYANYAGRLATSSSYALAVKKDGTIAAWGTDNVNIPPGMDNVIAVAAGPNYSLALKADGTVAAWGKNDYGQCNVPDDLSNVVDICIVGDSSIVLQADGTVRAWGRNAWGECTIPDTLSNVVDIQSGSRHVLALQADGTVRAWGYNRYGGCTVPDDLNNVVAIAAGYYHSIALKNDGTVVIWGGRYPIENLNLQYVKGIAAGKYDVAALKWDGTLVVWGNYFNQNVDLGVPVQFDKEILAISSSGDSGCSCLLALNQDGTLSAWVDGSFNDKVRDIPSGLNLFADESPYDGPAPDIPQTPADYAASDYVQAAARVRHTEFGYAILNMDGTVKFIPDATSDPFGLAQIPEGMSNVKTIATSYRNVMALQEDGSVVVWGLNDDGQCQVPESVQDITAICATREFNDCCLALKNDGSVIAWGNNAYGKCQVPEGLNNVIAIAAGDNHFLALKADGTVAAWGDNDYGQCNVPSDLNNVARVFAVKDFSLALKNDGTLAAWGENDYGQCDVPEGLSGVVDISLDATKCIALKNNGTVAVWGDNSYGSLSVPAGLHDVAAICYYPRTIKIDGTIETWILLSDVNNQTLGSLSNVLTINRDIVIFRDGTLQYFDSTPADNDTVNSQLEGLNVLSGHYFAIDAVDLLNSAGNSISSVPSQGGYRIQAGIDNNYASPTNGLTIIQVRGGDSASSESGGQVLGCVGVSSVIPVSGANVSSDFTLPAGVSGQAYVDVFVWDDWATMIPRAAANQNLSFTVSE